jgi:hypothetical protein
LRAVRPASGFVSGDTDAAPQSLTAHGLDRWLQGNISQLITQQ